MISAVWAFVFILTAVTVCGEIQISDSVTPLKIEISTADDSDTNGMISKNVSLRNTGDVPVDYVIYIESGGNSNAASLFELSANAASVGPGEKFELQISASIDEIEKYTAAELENIKIKLVRHPDTQTPVGYIIPVTINGKTDTKTNGAAGKTGSSETGAGISGGSDSSGGSGSSGANQTDEFFESTVSSGRNAATDGADGEISKIKTTEKYKIMIVALIVCFVLLSAGGLYADRNRKKE